MAEWFLYFNVIFWALFTVGSAYIAYRDFRDMNK